MSKKKFMIRVFILLWINGWSIFPVWSNANIFFKVTVLSSPSCIINGNYPIVINFGKEVMTTRVDGKNYREAVNYSLTCERPSSLSMRMLIQGAVADFDSSALRTSMPSLGVIFFAGGNKWPINTMSGFNYYTPPRIEAVLVKEKDKELHAGEFTAAATLEVFYQ
ncbi:fimbrial protein [Serratia nevei]|uniref:fimbrial protein n=1 Tax=Serratia nevei TaxID=2703794 RepID=UPI00313AC8C7